MIYVNRSQTSGDTRSLPIVMGSRSPNALLVPDPSNPNRLTYTMNTSDEKRNVGFAPYYVTVIAVENFSKKYSLPASIFVPISLNIQSLPGAQPTNVKVVKIHQNLYKNNWQLNFGNAKASWIPPPGVVQYAFIYDANPPGSGKNTVASSTVKLFKASEASVDPNYPNELMYITHNFYYPPAASYAGIVALYDDNPLYDQFYSIPESSYIPLNAHDNGPEYSGPPVKIFRSCTGENKEGDELKVSGGLKPGQYFFTQHYNDNIGYVYVPGGLIVELTQGNGKTISIEGGSEYYGKGLSICNNSGGNNQIMVVSVKGSGIAVNPAQGSPPRQSLTAEEAKKQKDIDEARKAKEQLEASYIDGKPLPPGKQPTQIDFSETRTAVNAIEIIFNSVWDPMPEAYIVIGSNNDSSVLLSKVRKIEMNFKTTDYFGGFGAQPDQYPTFRIRSILARSYRYVGVVAVYSSGNDFTIPSSMFVLNKLYDSSASQGAPGEVETPGSAYQIERDIYEKCKPIEIACRIPYDNNFRAGGLNTSEDYDTYLKCFSNNPGCDPRIISGMPARSIFLNRKGDSSVVLSSPR
jgi:hypothetical protein